MWVCVCVNVVFFPCISSRPPPPCLNNIQLFLYYFFQSLPLLHSLSLFFHVALPETELTTPQSSVCYFSSFFSAICTFFCATQFFLYFCCCLLLDVCLFVYLCTHPACYIYFFRVHFPTKAIEGWMGHIYVKRRS